ncbi:MAG: cob(I)yrinic acid a,c-diamide adenosyltransferase [Defluviitaleaceae bacterium]|nr:cob(I)yrinic acid a,c-diamide adenosyltransferase [Defluviitaleaceae bacterium]
MSYIQVYTGNGKGKTTAALGLCLRAVGAGKRIFFGQFMKDGDYCESRVLAERFPEVTYATYGARGFIRKGTENTTDTELALAGLAAAREELASGKYDIVILDELNVALFMDLLPLNDVLALLDARPTHTELILTGRYAHQAIVDRADLVSEIGEVKHYYTKGVNARTGIEM